MKKWVVAIFLLNLVLRLLFISWHPATYTDSITYMTALAQVRGTYILPGYPFALILVRKLVDDPQLAGRLVSVLSAAIVVFPLYGLGRIIYNRRAALLTILLYTCSPLIFRWSLRIFPHSLYSLLVVFFIYGVFRSAETGRVFFLAAGIFTGGLAILTYPTGLVLAPVAVVAVIIYFFKNVSDKNRSRAWVLSWLIGGLILGGIFFYWPTFRSRVYLYFKFLLETFPVTLPGPVSVWLLGFLGGGWMIITLVFFYIIPGNVRERGWWYRQPAAICFLLLSFSSYIFLHVWQKYLARSYWYQAGMKTSMRSFAGRWESWLTHYLYSFPYVLFYPVALFAVLGLLITIIRARKNSRQWLWLVFFGYFLVGIFYALVVNKWWTPRYQYSLVPFSLILAGFGLNWLIGLRKFRWLGIVSLAVCLAGSLIFTALVLYWSRDSFGDIRRIAHFIRDHYPDRRIFASEIRKVGFWSDLPLRGYTRTSRSSVQPGDLVLLVSWHTNIPREFRELNRRFTTEIVHKEQSDVMPLLADDIVDWAGRRLRGRANSPVVWEQRFQKQHFESWLVELKERREKGEEVITGGEEIGSFYASHLTPKTEHATYFDVGVWEVLVPVKKGEKVRLEMAHAREGPAGSFRLRAYTAQSPDGFPDRLLAESTLLEGAKEGEWSSWEFVAPGGKLFVGSSWPLGNWVYYERDRWPHQQLGTVMYYSRGNIPVNKAFPVITNLKISFPDREKEK